MPTVNSQLLLGSATFSTTGSVLAGLVILVLIVSVPLLIMELRGRQVSGLAWTVAPLAAVLSGAWWTLMRLRSSAQAAVDAPNEVAATLAARLFAESQVPLFMGCVVAVFAALPAIGKVGRLAELNIRELELRPLLVGIVGIGVVLVLVFGGVVDGFDLAGRQQWLVWSMIGALALFAVLAAHLGRGKSLVGVAVIVAAVIYVSGLAIEQERLVERAEVTAGLVGVDFEPQLALDEAEFERRRVRRVLDSPDKITLHGCWL